MANTSCLSAAPWYISSMPASLFLNDFTVLDLAFVDSLNGVSGDSYYVSAEIRGELDEKDFVLDFSLAKKSLKALVDEVFDHKLLVPMGAGISQISRDGLTIRAGEATFEYSCPRTAFELFPDVEISVGVLQYHLARLAMARMPANVKEVLFSLRSPACFATEANFRYTHGLRYHDGNCQRLFHGHRNPIEVFVDGRRSPQWETRIATEWNYAHFVALPTLRNRSDLDLSLGARAFQHQGVAEIEYESSHGLFRGRIPAARVVITESEPSIETMSALAWARLRDWGAQGDLRVVAFEGLNKGAAFSS